MFCLLACKKNSGKKVQRGGGIGGIGMLIERLKRSSINFFQENQTLNSRKVFYIAVVICKVCSGGNASAMLDIYEYGSTTGMRAFAQELDTTMACRRVLTRSQRRDQQGYTVGTMIPLKSHFLDISSYATVVGSSLRNSKPLPTPTKESLRVTLDLWP